MSQRDAFSSPALNVQTWLPDHTVNQAAPVASVRDLGVHLDNDMSMHTHITQLVCSCYGVWRQLCSIRRSLRVQHWQPWSPHSSRPRSTTAGLPQYELDRVQSLVQSHGCSSHGRCSQVRPCDTASDGLTLAADPQRIQYKQCVLVYGCLNGTAPGYLSDLTVSVGSTARRQFHLASTSDFVVPLTIAHQLETLRLPLQFHERGTVYRQPSAQPPSRSLHSKKELKSFLFGLSFCLWQGEHWLC